MHSEIVHILYVIGQYRDMYVYLLLCEFIRCGTNRTLNSGLHMQIMNTVLLTVLCNLPQIERCRPSRWRQRSAKIHDTIWCCVGLHIFPYPHHMEERLSLPQDRTNHVATNLEDTKENHFTHKPHLFRRTQHGFILTLRLLMSYIYIYIYIYGAPILDVSRSHTTTQHSR